MFCFVFYVKIDQSDLFLLTSPWLKASVHCKVFIMLAVKYKKASAPCCLRFSQRLTKENAATC